MIDNFPEQEFPIYTNNLDVKLNRKNIDKDFVIYQIGTTNSFFTTNVLDITSDDFKAFSVAYYTKNRWFALFIRGKDNLNEFAKLVQSKDSSATINIVNTLSTDYESNSAIKDVELVQLLVNSLKNNKTFEYNNITGALYYKPDIVLNTTSFELLKLRFFTPTKDSIALGADFESFTEYKSLVEYKPSAKRTHVFDKENGEFRKALQSDFEFNKENPKDRYIFFSKGVITKKGKKKHQFLNFNTYQQYILSKSGLIAQFFNDVEKTLSSYLSIGQSPIINYASFDNPRAEYENNDYVAYLANKKRGFSVVDTIKNIESKELQERIIEQLKREYNISDILTERSNNNYVIEIIHDKDSGFYDSKKEDSRQFLFPELLKPDQHNLFTEEDIIQHVTLENFKLINPLSETDEKKRKKIVRLNHDMMKNIIQELIIKGDIYDRCISIVNWSEEKEWNFVCCGTGKCNSLKGCNEYIYYKANISIEGMLTLTTFDSSKIPEDAEWEIIDKIFRFYNKNNVKYHPVECIIYNDISKVNVIYRTKQFTLPNLEKLTADLALSDKNNSVPKSRIINQLLSFEQENKELSEAEKKEIAHLRRNLENEKSENILLDSLLKDIRIQSIGRILDYFEEQDSDNPQFLLHARPKAGDNMYENFSSLLGLKIAKINGIYEYFVGKKKEALKYSLPCSCIIRSVTSWINGELNDSGEVFLDEFAHMLTVEFVRNGQYTVIPFPMKYLREYQRFIEKDEDFDE